MWDANNETSNIRVALSDYNDRMSQANKLLLHENSCPRQQILSQAIDEKTLENIKSNNINNVHFQAHLNLTAATGAGAWLHSVPSKALGTHIDGQLYCTMVQRWLRVPLHDAEFHCPYRMK